MSTREIGERAQRALRHRIDAAAFHAAPGLWRSGWEPDIASLLCRPPLDEPMGFLVKARADGLRRQFPAEIERLLAGADAALAGRYRFFGYPEVVIGSEHTDDVDPFSGRPWPSRHAKRIEFRREPVGDPKWIWELNRVQHLPLLAAAWLVSGDERYGAAAGTRMQAWIDGHAPGRGIAWANGFEAGLRAISLAVTLDALRGSEHLSSARAGPALRSLWQHVRWIRRDPSTGSSANNHRIGELVGLLVVGCLAPELEIAAELVEDTADRLSDEAARQIRPDGTSVEQAFGYHVFVLDLLLVAVGVLDAAGFAVPHGLLAALGRSGDALWAQLGDDEPEPTYGDSDESRALSVDGGGRRDARGVAAGIACRLGHAKAARAAGGVDVTAWWLFGEAARIADVPPAPQPGSEMLADGGLTVLRARGRRLLIDHGPHGHLGIAAHAHADALALDVSVGGRRLVVDPGVGSYGRRDLREAFRGTAFHATVLVDEVSSSTAGGPFLWTEHATGRLLFANLDSGLVLASHDGYERLGDPVSHRRAVAIVRDDWIVVLDRLDARERHRYAQRWPLHSDLELADSGADGITASVAGLGLGVRLVFAASHDLAVRTVRGSRTPLEGWGSEGLESVVPSLLVSAALEAAGPVQVAALIAPFDGGRAPTPHVVLEAGPDVSRVEVRSAAAVDVVEVSFASEEIAVERRTERQ